MVGPSPQFGVAEEIQMNAFVQQDAQKEYPSLFFCCARPPSAANVDCDCISFAGLMACGSRVETRGIIDPFQFNISKTVEKEKFANIRNDFSRGVGKELEQLDPLAYPAFAEVCFE